MTILRIEPAMQAFMAGSVLCKKVNGRCFMNFLKFLYLLWLILIAPIAFTGTLLWSFAMICIGEDTIEGAAAQVIDCMNSYFLLSREGWPW